MYVDMCVCAVCMCLVNGWMVYTLHCYSIPFLFSPPIAYHTLSIATPFLSCSLLQLPIPHSPLLLPFLFSPPIAYPTLSIATPFPVLSSNCLSRTLHCYSLPFLFSLPIAYHTLFIATPFPVLSSNCLSHTLHCYSLSCSLFQLPITHSSLLLPFLFSPPIAYPTLFIATPFPVLSSNCLSHTLHCYSIPFLFSPPIAYHTLFIATPFPVLSSNCLSHTLHCYSLSCFLLQLPIPHSPLLLPPFPVLSSNCLSHTLHCYSLPFLFSPPIAYPTLSIATPFPVLSSNCLSHTLHCYSLSCSLLQLPIPHSPLLLPFLFSPPIAYPTLSIATPSLSCSLFQLPITHSSLLLPPFPVLSSNCLSHTLHCYSLPFLFSPPIAYHTFSIATPFLSCSLLQLPIPHSPFLLPPFPVLSSNCLSHNSQVPSTVTELSGSMGLLGRGCRVEQC